MSKKQEKNKVLSLIIVLLLTAIIVLAGLYVSEQRKISLAVNDSETAKNTTGDEIAEEEEEETEIDEVEEKVKTYEAQDVLSKKLSAKVNFPSYTLENMIEKVTITTNNISNSLALEMAWGRLEKVYELDTEIKENATNTIYSATEQMIENVIEDIFGTEFEYTNASFDALGDEMFSGYRNYISDVIYSSNSNTYSVSSIPGGGAATAAIYQEFSKLEVIGTDVAKLYVKIGYISPVIDVNEDGIPVETLEIYKSYVNNEFAGLVQEIDMLQYENLEVDEVNNVLTPNEDVSIAHELLNTFVYTFEMDENTREYNLVEFDIEI